MHINRLLPLLFVCFTIPLRAQAVQDPVRMVTFFPAPYVAYSTLDVTNSLDIGAGNAGRLVIGSADMPAGPANPILEFTTSQQVQTRGSIVLENGTLQFPQVLSINSTGVPNGTQPSMTLGDPADPTGSSAAVMAFRSSLAINHVYGLTSFYADNLKVQTLKLFGKNFPSCKDKNGTGKMAWETLSLGPDEPSYLFLTCAMNECQPGQTYTVSIPCHEYDSDLCGGYVTKTGTCSSDGTFSENETVDTSGCTQRPQQGHETLSPAIYCPCTNHVFFPPATSAAEVGGMVGGSVYHTRDIECSDNGTGTFQWQVANTDNGHNGWSQWQNSPDAPCIGWALQEEFDDWQYNDIWNPYDECKQPGGGLSWEDYPGYTHWPNQGCANASDLGNEKIQLWDSVTILFGHRCIYRRYKCVLLQVSPWEPLSCM